MPEQNSNQPIRWYQRKGLTAEIQKTLKRANRRLAVLAQTYGKDSNVYRNEIAVFKKDPAWRRYLTISDPTGSPQYKKGKSAGGKRNDKFDVHKFNQDIRSGKLSRSAANNFLMNAGGLRINADGSTQQLPVSGISTVKSLKEKAKARLERRSEDEKKKFTQEEIKKEVERSANISQSFDTEYEEYIANYTESGAKRDAIVKKLWDVSNKGSRYDRKLTDKELNEIIARMKYLNEQHKKKAKAVERKGGRSERVEGNIGTREGRRKENRGKRG